MDGNPGDTPNPLNPNQENGAVEPTPTPTPTAGPIVEPNTEPTTEPAIEPADPANRPMEKAPAEETPKPKKGKKGLIIGAIIALVLAIGCAVAAIIIANMNKGDVVAKAVMKVINGEAPENLGFDGTVTINAKDQTSQVTDLKVSLSGEGVVKSLINSSNAKLTANLKNGGSLTLDISEVYAANGNLYFKVDGISKILEDPNLLQGTNTTIIEDAETTTEETTTEETVKEEVVDTSTSSLEFLSAALESFKVIDGQWIQIPTEYVEEITSSFTADDETSCMNKLVSSSSEYKNTISKLYTDSPFITSSTENIPITSQNNPVYRVTIDSEGLTSFLNAFQGTSMFEDFKSCINKEEEITIDTNQIVEEVKKLPEIYVEIDRDYNFTRIYLAPEIEDQASIVVDFNLSYPANADVAEPTEFKDINTLMEEMTKLETTEKAAVSL